MCASASNVDSVAGRYTKSMSRKESKGSVHIEERGENPHLLLDRHGLPLVPQPSSDPLDPLLYPQWLKILILLQVSWLACLGIMNHSIINPGYVPLAMYFHISTVTASYQTTIALVFAGIGPFIWVPLSQVIGRRPVYVSTWVLAIASTVGAGASQSFGTLLVARAFQGLTTSAAMALGAATVSDIFYLHERARAMGIFTVFLTNGAHVSPIPGGFLAQYIGWRWTFYFVSILDGATLILLVFLLPETLYKRTSSTMSVSELYEPLSFAQVMKVKLQLWGHRPEGAKLYAVDFVRPFQMALHPSVVFSAIYYMVTFAFASILPAVSAATLFSRLYKFTPSKTGLALGLSTVIGTALGELAAGRVLDQFIFQYRKKHGGDIAAETGLRGIWPGAFLVPSGLLIFGFCIQYKTHWIGPCMGIAVACFGIQIISTVLYTYIAACYKPQTGDSAQVFNFARQVFGFTLGFWVIPFGDSIGYQFSLLALALVTIVCFLPVLWLMRWGPRHKSS